SSWTFPIPCGRPCRAASSSWWPPAPRRSATSGTGSPSAAGRSPSTWPPTGERRGTSGTSSSSSSGPAPSASGRGPLREFLALVDNPAWNGILALRVDVGLENFPDDLKGLLAGIVQEDF